ncbi:DUF58 domain-containing protein [Desulfurobacterium atlanticum]|uniref:DUF58 domain-containing protein n=1 Tax=Desulfurobacterium atlanticum TaxID=240169 RepID=A0A238ZY81_9BACT|nr:DUF58 domain-containing protein [Desulfurobacterium atlanticum]SNR87961.1 Protein of unknown function DUF58 [Desulfurobacterium atlanticum]
MSKLSLKIEPITEVFAKRPTLFKLTVKNEKKFFPSFLIKTEIGQSTALIPVVDNKSESSTFTELTFPERGRLQEIKARIVSPFPFGFFYIEKETVINADFIVYPTPLKTEYPKSEEGKKGDEKKAIGSGREEIKKIREYVSGDEIKNIHWKVSARKGTLFTKEFEGKNTAKPLIIELEKLTGTLEEKLSKATYLAIKNSRTKGVGLKSGNVLIKPDKNPITLKKILKYLALYKKEEAE